MKPYKSFLFVLLLVAALWAGCYFWGEPWEGFVVREADAFIENLERGLKARAPYGMRTSRSASHLKTDPAPEAQNEPDLFSTLQELWAQDPLMNTYKEIYRLDTDIFKDPRLQDIPLTPFESDGNLLDDFFVKLLILRNPAYEESLRQWYAKPDFWEEPLAGNRKNFVRILHYGDKQIENDRITSTLRNLFQSHFGGYGPGLLPLFPNNAGYKNTGKNKAKKETACKISGSWHTVKIDKNTRKGNFGVYGAHLTSPLLTNIVKGKKQDKGFIGYTIPKTLPASTSLVLEAVVHTDVPAKNFQVKVDGKPLEKSADLASFTQQRYDYCIPAGSAKIEIEVNLRQKNQTLYALALNDTVGISVDNLPVPNTAGTVFTPNNRRFLTDQLNLLNTGLIIYQFSPGAAHAAKPDYYRVLLMQELSYIRAQLPSVPVIVAGMGGMEQIQREVALQTGCIYWNAPDGTEAELMGKLFYKAFLNAYRDFLIRERKTSMMARAKQLQEQKGGTR